MTPAAKLAVELGAPIAEIEGRKLPPMLCAQDDSALRVLAQRGWIFELKLDGVRIVADKRGSEVSLAYRKQRDATSSYPEIAAAIAELGEDRVVLDGEIVAFDEQGMPDFQRLAQRIHGERGKTSVGVVYVVFDVLAIGDRDLRGLPLEARKAILARVVPEETRGPVRLHPTFEDGDALFRVCREKGLEGVVAKRGGSIYRPGERGSDWVKVKHEREADLVVVGWTEGEGRRSRLGALDIASFDGGRLVVRGAVGSGLDEDTIDVLLDRLRASEIPEPAAEGRWSALGRKRRYVRPEIVVSVRYMTFTSDGVLRFPVFRGVRADVQPGDCTVAPSGGGGGRRHVTAREAVVLPDGTTKDALCNHYDRVAGALLPYLAERPAVLLRPDGPLWPLPRWAPSWLRTSAGNVPGVRGVLVDAVDALHFAVDAGAVTLLATALSAEGDWIILRGDRAGARAVHAVTQAIGLPACAKHAEGGAIDVLVPLGHAPRDVGRALGALLARLATEDAGTEVALAPSTVAPWAVLVDGGRARVAAPLAWEDLDRAPPGLEDADPSQDPMRALLGAEVDVGRAAQALERFVAKR